ncbi:hypothetical protein K1719_025718 [Acacia pycnantha]|nr:hypothetical protein K1719_025718 [Acacia pycnantha]
MRDGDRIRPKLRESPIENFGNNKRSFSPVTKTSYDQLLNGTLQRKVTSVKQLVALYEVPDISVPRYVRVNTLKLDVDSTLLELSKKYAVLSVSMSLIISNLY